MVDSMKKSASASEKKPSCSREWKVAERKMRGKRVIITFHSQGDSDAVGAAIALFRALGKSSAIALPDRPTSSARKLIDFSGAKTSPFSELSVSGKDFIIVLDSSSPKMLPHLAGLKIGLMVDHHGRFGGELSADVEISDPCASSTCEIMHLLLDTKDKISCAALLSGIVSDSANFKYATPQTFSAASELLSRSGVSYSEILSLSHIPEHLDERIEALRSCSSVNAERIGEHIIATAMAKSHEAHFADILVALGADIAFVGCSGEDARISARMRDSLKGMVRLDSIMHEIGKILGGSGSGHELAAGATGKKENLRAALGICIKLAEQEILSGERGRIKKIEW